jgi:putative hemin transport protein
MPALLKDFATIWLEYQIIKTREPAKYIRDIARELSISEAELCYARIGNDATLLNGEMRDILAALEAVGETKCICRNEYAVHEHIGSFSNQHISERAGLVLNPRALDLRLFLHHWASAFSVKEQTIHGERQSIQFFDNQGDAVLKVCATCQTNMAEWNAIVDKFTEHNPLPLAITTAVTEHYAEHADASSVDQAWRAMTDVHQFFGLLKKHNISRQQAFRLVGDDLACKVSNAALSRLLETVLQSGNEIMIFVGNQGCVQIFTGIVEKLIPMKGWINIFNKRFTLHLAESAVAESWVTQKPTAEGYVTSLELFAEDGTQIMQVYGQRTEGQPEQQRWRAQVNALRATGSAA